MQKWKGIEAYQDARLITGDLDPSLRKVNMFITTMLVRLTNNDVMMQASASAKSERL